MGRKRRNRKRRNANNLVTEIPNSIPVENVFPPPAKRPTIIGLRPDISMYRSNYPSAQMQGFPFLSRFPSNYPYHGGLPLSNSYWPVCPAPPVHSPVAVVRPLRTIQIEPWTGNVCSVPSTLSVPVSIKSSRTSSSYGFQVAGCASNAYQVPSTRSEITSVKSPRRSSSYGFQAVGSAANSYPVPTTRSTPDSVKSSRGSSSSYGFQAVGSAANAYQVPSTKPELDSVKSSKTSSFGFQVVGSSANAYTVPTTRSVTNSVKSSMTLTEQTSLSNTPSVQDKIASSRAKALAVYAAACEARKIACKSKTVNLSSDITVTALSTNQQVTQPSVNVGGCKTALNVGTSNEEEDDVIYLYSVQPEKGKLIEVVDLSEDSNAISSERKLFLSSQNTTSQDHGGGKKIPFYLHAQDKTEMKQDLNKNMSDSQVFKAPSLDKNKGPVLPLPAAKKRKREENVDTNCSECHKTYAGAGKDGNQLFISKCGHLFCVSCLKNLVPYKCTECNAGIANLCKVVF